MKFAKLIFPSSVILNFFLSGLIFQVSAAGQRASDFSSGSSEPGMVIMLLFYCCYCLFFLFVIAMEVLTIAMQVDAAKRENYGDKSLWIVLLGIGLIVWPLSWIFVPLYYFLQKRKFDSEGK